MRATLAGAAGLIIGLVVGVLVGVALPEPEPEPGRELETEPVYTGRLEPLTLVDDFTGEEERVIRAIGREGNLRLDIVCVANYVAVALAPVSGSFQSDNVEARWDGGESGYPFGIGSERRGNSVGMSELISPLALPVPHNFSLDFMKPLRYGGEHGDSESGRAQPAGQPHPTASGAGRVGIAGHSRPRAGCRSRL